MWLLFFLKGVSSQALDAITRIERLGQLRAAYQERLRTERAAARLLQTLDVLFERLILNIRQLEATLDVPYRTAQRYIERLEEIGPQAPSPPARPQPPEDSDLRPLER